jgi:insulysin
LNITWQLPFSEDKWRSKPNTYISHVLGHEGKNSLLSHLIESGLATALSSSASSRIKAIDLVEVSINLTEKGEKEYLKILEIVYSFINKIKKDGV